MKITLLSLSAAAIWSAAAPAFANPQTAAAAETLSPLESVSVTAHRFHVEPQEFMDYEYSYTLNSGDVVHFSRRVGRFYVTILGQSPVEIFPTSADHFETKGGAKLTFTEAGDALNIDHFELLQLASGVSVAHAPAAK